MTIPATAEQIYDLLVADPVVSASLGTYTSPTGATGPAVAVLAANEKLPEGTTASGIEVVITRVPGFAPRALLDEGAMTNPTWRIYVLGWHSAAQLQAVAERIIALLPGATAANVPGDAPGDGIGVMDQVVIAWTNPCAVVLA